MNVRGIARDAVRDHVMSTAVELFTRRGFDDVTIGEIAADAGISVRTFHRYFPSKEDTIMGDIEAHGEVVRAAFAGRPASEPVWQSLLIAVGAVLETSSNRARGRKRMLLMVSTASLRARYLEKHLTWSRLLVPLVAERLGGEDATLRAHAIVQAALGCWEVAMYRWARGAPDTPAEEVLRIAFDAVRPAGM